MMTSSAPANSSEANLALFHQFYQCFLDNDLDTMRNQVMAPDVVWHIPGQHTLSGTHRGVDEILAYFGAVGSSNFNSEMRYLHADDNYVVQVHRGWSNRGDGTDIDMLWVLVYRIENGRIAEAQEFAEDQAAANAFFSRHYPLAAVPQRLRNA
jgi:ketosteroid isomerase-like protein